MTCGDGDIDDLEDCDGADLGEQTCQSLGYAGGPLFCAPDCRFDTEQCVPAPECGDGTRDGTEQCDSADLNGQTCEGLGYGTLGCSAACQFDTTDCVIPPLCGNGVIEPTTEPPEQCDGSELNNETCFPRIKRETDPERLLPLVYSPKYRARTIP